MINNSSIKYAFVSNSHLLPEGKLKQGGPFWCACSIEGMLKRHSINLNYQIIKNDFRKFFSRIEKNRLIHIQSNNQIIEYAIDYNLPIIIGPNVVWKNTSNRVVKYPKIKRVLTLRSDPAPRKRNAQLQNKISYFPPFVDELFFMPTAAKKSIDVLTVGKSFYYPEYESNYHQLVFWIKKHHLRHVHLKGFSHEQLKKTLYHTKLLAYPSPRESGAGVCHILLEANMMNVPFVGLSSVVKRQQEEFHESRGFIANSIGIMGRNLPRYIKLSTTKRPRKWTVKHYSYKAAFKKLMNILQLC